MERHPTTSIHPRLRGVNARTMEIFRELGLEEDIRAAGAELAPSHGMLSGETLTKALETFRADPRENVQLAFDPFQHGERRDDLSPTYGCRVTLDRLEPVLLSAARKRGGDLRFNTECVTFEQDETGVTATLVERASGARSQIRADYLIAADGAGRPIRQALGASTGGRGSLGHLLNILFTADLRDLVRSREFSLCLIKRPEVRGLLTSINNTERWVFHVSYEAEQGVTPAEYPPERCLELLHLALGVPQVNIEIKSILPWECAVRVADDFQHGRILLAGDAAHQMPPWGGHGGNSGVACEAVREVAARFNVTLAAYRVGQQADLLDLENCWRHKAGIQADGALLVRPDGFVAWRCRNLTGDPQQMLGRVLVRLLCREPELISL